MGEKHNIYIHTREKVYICCFKVGETMSQSIFTYDIFLRVGVPIENKKRTTNIQYM
jgi:hypothetical protein